MISRLRARLTFANVMACSAVFIALGGTGYAAIKIPKASVGTKQLKKNAVTSAKVKNGSLSPGDIKSGSFVTPSAAASDFLSPAEGNARYLGINGTAANATNAANAAQAGNAAQLDNLDSTAFVQGGGRVLQETVYPFANPGSPGAGEGEIDIPGYGVLEYSCTGASFNIGFRSNQEFGAAVWTGDWDAGVEQTDIPEGGSAPLVLAGATNTPGDEALNMGEVHIAAENGLAALTVFIEHVRGGQPTMANCRATVHGVLTPE